MFPGRGEPCVAEGHFTSHIDLGGWIKSQGRTCGWGSSVVWLQSLHLRTPPLPPSAAQTIRRSRFSNHSGSPPGTTFPPARSAERRAWDVTVASGSVVQHLKKFGWRLRWNRGGLNYHSQRAPRSGAEPFLSRSRRSLFPIRPHRRGDLTPRVSLCRRWNCPRSFQSWWVWAPRLCLYSLMWRFLRLEDFWGMAVQSPVLRALWKTPTHLLRTVAVTQ